MALVPWLADQVDALTSFDDVKLLDVQLNRLRRWYTDGLLLIGDAAHAMSPVGGVGHQPGRRRRRRRRPDPGRPAARGAGAHPADLARVQARRWVPAALIQRGATARPRPGHRGRRVGAEDSRADRPRAVRIANGFPAAAPAAGYGVAIGPLPEHAPEYARR